MMEQIGAAVEEEVVAYKAATAADEAELAAYKADGAAASKAEAAIEAEVAAYKATPAADEAKAAADAAIEAEVAVRKAFVAAADEAKVAARKAVAAQARVGFFVVAAHPEAKVIEHQLSLRRTSRSLLDTFEENREIIRILVVLRGGGNMTTAENLDRNIDMVKRSLEALAALAGSKLAAHRKLVLASGMLALPGSTCVVLEGVVSSLYNVKNHLSQAIHYMLCVLHESQPDDYAKTFDACSSKQSSAAGNTESHIFSARENLRSAVNALKHDEEFVSQSSLVVDALSKVSKDITGINQVVMRWVSAEAVKERAMR